MTFLVRLPTCGRKPGSSTPFWSRAPRWSYCNALLSVTVRPSPEMACTVRSSHWLTALIQRLPGVTSLSLICRVSGRTSRSPTLQPDTGADSVNVVLPASGSVARRTNVGVRTLPCMDALPKIMRPVPNWSGSATLPPSGESAMMISAVTSAAIGVAAVPTCRMPRVPIPISPAMTWRFVTFSRVLTVGANARVPSTAIVYATAVMSLMVTVCPSTTRTTWLRVGTWPPSHVAGLDQLPLCTDATAGRETSAEKSGMLSGSVTRLAHLGSAGSASGSRRAEKKHGDAVGESSSPHRAEYSLPANDFHRHHHVVVRPNALSKQRIHPCADRDERLRLVGHRWPLRGRSSDLVVLFCLSNDYSVAAEGTMHVRDMPFGDEASLSSWGSVA